MHLTCSTEGTTFSSNPSVLTTRDINNSLAPQKLHIMWLWPGSSMAWRNHTAGKKGWLKESAIQRRKEKPVCTAHQSDWLPMAGKTQMYLFFFFFLLLANLWLLISVQILHTKKSNKEEFLKCIYCSLCHISAWITSAEVEAHKLPNTCDDILATTFVVFTACVNKQFQTLQYAVPSSERRAQSSTRQRRLCLLGALWRRSRKTPVICLDDENPTGAQFKWTTMISNGMSA